VVAYREEKKGRSARRLLDKGNKRHPPAIGEDKARRRFLRNFEERGQPRLSKKVCPRFELEATASKRPEIEDLYPDAKRIERGSERWRSARSKSGRD